MGSSTEFDTEFLPFLVGDVLKDFIDRSTDRNYSDRIRILFFKDLSDTSNRFCNLKGDIFSVYLYIVSDVLAANIFNSC